MDYSVFSSKFYGLSANDRILIQGITAEEEFYIDCGYWYTDQLGNEYRITEEERDRLSDDEFYKLLSENGLDTNSLTEGKYRLIYIDN